MINLSKTEFNKWKKYIKDNCKPLDVNSNDYRIFEMHHKTMGILGFDVAKQDETMLKLGAKLDKLEGKNVFSKKNKKGG